MTCSRCGGAKPVSEFTKLNRTKDGKRGLCKLCKKKSDAEDNAEKSEKQKELPYFPLTANLLSRTSRPRIGVLKPYKVIERLTVKDKQFHELPYTGLKAVLNELAEGYEYCTAENINEYKFVLASLTSVMDIENLIYTMERYGPRERKAKVIVGGFGVCNIKLILPYIDIAVFGRAEGQINKIIRGQELPNVWRKEVDPHVEGRYEVRQPQYLLPGEAGVGCRHRCKFCQYAHVRKAIAAGEAYNPGKAYTHTVETDWNSLEINGPGHYTTAWDGWSEESRRRVAKPVTWQNITDKILKVGNRDFPETVFIKVFQIVGYPWETAESVLGDINDTLMELKTLKREVKHRTVIAFLNTPFGPEPLTPMQYERADIYTNWHQVLQKVKKVKGDNLHLTLLPAVNGPFTVMKRVFINRAGAGDLETFKKMVFTSKLNGTPNYLRVKWLIKHGIIDPAMFGEIKSAEFDYLRVDPKVERDPQIRA